MDRLLQKILQRDLVIDERPEDISGFLTEEEEKAHKRESADTGDKKPPTPNPSEEDLFRQIADLLLEQERLQNLAEELRNREQGSTDKGYRDFFKRALPVLDSLDRILHMYEKQEEPPPELRNWVKSVSALRTRVVNLFEGYGLRAMDPIGKSVNLDRHEVVDIVHNDSLPDETVVEVLQKGYIYNGKNLRDARVVVAKNERS